MLMRNQVNYRIHLAFRKNVTKTFLIIARNNAVFTQEHFPQQLPFVLLSFDGGIRVEQIEVAVQVTFLMTAVTPEPKFVLN